MDSAALKEYVKACIDCNIVLYEVPRIKKRIDENIASLNDDIVKVDEECKRNMPKSPKYPAPIHTVSLTYSSNDNSKYSESKYIARLGEIIIEENLYPSNYTIIYSNYFLTANPWHDAKYKCSIKSDSDKIEFVRKLKVYLYEKESPTRDIDEIVFPLFYRKKFENACTRAKPKPLTQEQLKQREKYVQECQEYEKNKEELLKDYNNKIKNYNNKLSEHNRMYNEQKLLITEKKQMLLKERAEFDACYSEANSNLSKLMNADIIHMKYRDLACLCSMYEYLDTGRCNELTGPFGAYQRYEEELATGKIISSLDRIEGKLDQIMVNQRSLAMTMVECSRRINESINNMNKSIETQLDNITGSFNNLSDSVGHLNNTVASINGNLYATKYHVERIAKMTDFVNSMKFAKGEFIGFEYNYPY